MKISNRLAYGVAAMMICGLAMAEPALAAGGVEAALTSIITMLTGAIGKGVATLAIMAIGAAWMFGQMEMRTAGACVIGIGIFFGAATLVSTIAGS
jgi:type IV secretion system protein VirB2